VIPHGTFYPQPVLNAPEVDTLFSHPLASFLSTQFPERAGPRGPFLEAEAHAETAALELQYHTYSDVPWPWHWLAHPTSAHPPSRAVRMHRFLTGREAGGIKPIYGLTACVLSSRSLGTPSDSLPLPHTAPSSSVPRPSLTTAHQSFQCRRVRSLRSTSAFRGRCVTPGKDLRKPYAKKALMPHAPRGSGINGKVGGGERVGSDNGWHPDCEGRRRYRLLLVLASLILPPLHFILSPCWYCDISGLMQ
jgi:hypothetical protein